MCVYVGFVSSLSIYVYICMCRYYTTICCLLKRQMFCLDCTLFNSFVLHFREFIFCVDANNADVHSQTTDLDKDGVCTFFFKYALKCNNTKKNCRTKKTPSSEQTIFAFFAIVDSFCRLIINFKSNMYKNKPYKHTHKE